MGSGGLRRFFKKESSTEDEIKQLVDEDENDLEISQRELINNVFEFDDTTAGDIMTHRTDIVAVEDDKTLYDVVEAAINEGCSRIPIFHEDLDNILGIVYVKDLLKFIGTQISKDESIKDYIREPLFIPETIPCGKLFAKMTETRIQLAIVVDEYGGTAGLVTLEDIIEELVGDIEDEYDEDEESVKKLDESTYIFEGITDIEDAAEILKIQFPDGDYDTLAGFVINQLGFVPSYKDINAKATYNNITFTVLAVEDRRIESIKVKIGD
jgi:putative hemolysin